MAVVVSTFYKFVAISDCEALRASLTELCRASAIRGTIVIANEGVNATISGKAPAIAALLAVLRSDQRFADLSSREIETRDHPFGRLKIKVKPEIVTFGAPEADPFLRVGRYVKPEDWDALIGGPDVILIDARNHYEIAVGSFAGARDPGTRSFSEFPAFVERELAGHKHKRIAMFCTGGIRCEKASSYLLSQGFAEVYQLQGGILNYLTRSPPDAGRWRGACFVFDGRVALGFRGAKGSHALCDD